MPRQSEKAKLINKLFEQSCIELLLLDDSDEDEESDIFKNLCDDFCMITANRYAVPRLPIPKSTDWIKLVLPNVSEDRFKMFLRMERATFNALLSKIRENPCFNSAVNRQYPVEIQLAVTLYRLGSSGDGATVRKIATLFGVGDGGSIDMMTRRVFSAISQLESEYLYWPSQNEKRQMIANTIQELPHCIGYIDGSEIYLAERPCHDPDSYYSRKSRFAIKIQAVCDYQMKIRHVFVGYPGRVHDMRIFANSSLFLNPSKYFHGDEWLAADSAYTLSRTIITPFRKNSPEPEATKNFFNKIHSEHRVRIEHCFGYLKERFGSLKELRMRLINKESSTYACQWITICCILHNFIIEHNGNVSDFYYTLENNQDDEENAPILIAADSPGEEKRKAILNLLLESHSN